MSEFKDLFSRQSGDYAKFRPRYPAELFRYLASLTESHDLAWDCGTGNGQAAVSLAGYFAQVVATDPSEKQLAHAESRSNVHYKIAPAENAPLADKAVDLVIVAQAFHWFRHPEFFAEVQRVLKPQGAIAIWSYNLCRVNPEVDQTISELYSQILGPYWESERKLVENGYRDCAFPFREIAAPAFRMNAQWGVEEMIGYLQTWSALQTYITKNGTSPVPAIRTKLERLWPDQQTLTVHWDLAIRVGRN